MKVGLDRRTTLGGAPKDQRQLAQQLQANRIEVVLQKGAALGPEYQRVGRTVTGTGIQHAKCLLADNMLVVGSTNWTTSSRGNSEVGVLIRLRSSAEQVVKEMLESRLVGAETLEVALSKPRRSRSQMSRADVDDEIVEGCVWWRHSLVDNCR